MSFHSTPYKPRAPLAEPASTPIRSSSTNRFRSSLVPSNRPSPARALNPSTRLSETPASARDLFRPSTPRSQRPARLATELPAESTRQNDSARRFAPLRSASSGMANTPSTEPFKMRIPSPDPELSGEVVAKSIPDDPSRKNKYADEIFGPLCPPGYDEQQRRQWFCVLDLRRLKYAADEIFAQKDWKLNILNFAKEYEKSRGLIMLRYGLYEFKNVKPSSEVLKRWRAAHNLPDLEDNSQTVPSTGSMKRKADGDLTPNDNPLMNSTANQNKRRNVDQVANDPFSASPAQFKKSKRKVDDTDEVDENQPNKLHKPSQSSAKSLFASIIDKPRDAANSPSKDSLQASNPFTASKPKDSKQGDSASKPNLFQQPTNSPFASTKSNGLGSSAGSVLSGQKTGSAQPTSGRNVFSYSPGSPGSSSDSEDDDNAGEKEDEPEDQQPSSAVSTGTSTPPVGNGTSVFTTGSKSNSLNPFAGSSSTPAQTPRGGLFERVQIGTNGKPVRAVFEDEKKDSSTAQQSTPAPVKPPGDYTFNPATTPISFSQPASTAPKSTSAGDTDASSSAKPTPSGSAQPDKPASIFTSGSQAAPAPLSSSFGTAKASIFPSATASPSLFAGKPAGSVTNLFGASTPNGSSTITNTDQQTEPTASTVPEKAPSVFSKPVTDTLAADEKKSPPLNGDNTKTPSIFDQSFIAKNAVQAKSSSNAKGFEAAPGFFSRSANQLFGAGKDASSAPANEDKAPSIFDQSLTAKKAEEAKSTSNTNDSKAPANIFSQSVSNASFGTPHTNGATATGTKSIFGQTDKSVAAGPSSDGQRAADTKPIFGSMAKQSSTVSGSDASKSDARQEGEKGDKTATSGLQDPSPPVAAPATSLFAPQGEAKSATPASTVLFGGAKSNGLAESAKPASSIFANTPTSKGPSFIFGSQQTSNANTQSPSVSFGASTTSGVGVSFGSSSFQANGNEPKKIEFQFTSSAPTASSTPFTFGQGSSPASGFSFTAGGSGQTINNPFASKSSSQASTSVFGANSATTTPSSSFNFTMQSQGQPATPKAAPSSQGSTVFGAGPSTNSAAPSFSFTQATPSQSTPNAMTTKSSAPTSIFSHLQAAGEASAGASSPFPVPSSMGTTPVNGTPEPQGPNENGEEPPQQQISLTEGGPGEEDETILHEVRAKAIMFVPVQKDEDDEDTKKSPWSTKGVGPLRILKNKTTGTVRMLLRAEPRGHIALNKALLPDVEYTARDKTINFAAANDSGSGLETWVLQVKKPEFARELVKVLESNKSANRK